MARVAAHLRDAVEQAVDVAQLVVDTVKEMHRHRRSRAGRHAYIPIFGQVQLVKRLRDVVKLLWDAKKVVAVFWYFLLVHQGLLRRSRLTCSLASRFLPRRRCRPEAA